MKERPILFSTEMVQAILDGRKTQTRRVIKDSILEKIMPFPHPAFGIDIFKYCPFGIKGDLLWVRETWRPHAWYEGEPIVIEFKDGRIMEDKSTGYELNYEDWATNQWIEISDELDAKGARVDENGFYDKDAQKLLSWRPSIFMPRWCSRIDLEITNIRVERLQEISKGDALAEGIYPNEQPPVEFDRTYGNNMPVHLFGGFWDFINSKRGYSWDFNPWVWVVEFKRL